MGVQKHNKKNVQKAIVSKRSKTGFSSFLITFLGVSRGVQKHHKKMSKHKSDPGPFLAFDLPTHPRALAAGRYCAFS
jgi:hypothetical protein